ncbi:hypothetical protein M885DRAFT_518360 [Pelagophyceae sp. CCMP2097]|nr:hypothetical protein M885DRAFT_518360 [Pelagophyceae sp. CCMP2097]
MDHEKPPQCVATITGTNARLKAEKEDYKSLFGTMAGQLEEWKAAHDLSRSAQALRVTSFKEASEQLMLGLDDVRTVLEEKEFQLWEKEGLLEYQEERLLDSEDQEVAMALYVNLLAVQLLALNVSLPEGLEEQPYFSQGDAQKQRASDDDAMERDDAAGLESGENGLVVRRRRLQAPRAVETYRDHLLHVAPQQMRGGAASQKTPKHPALRAARRRTA